MYKGIYIAMTGAQLKYQELDNITQNLANANTTGYKKTSFSTRLYPLLEGIADKQNAVYPDARSMAVIGRSVVDTSAGSVIQTGNTLDMACVGDGFFAVQGTGNIYYTRNGNFSRSKEGYLVDASGQQVLDTDNKPISVAGNTVQIAPDGTVYLDGSVTNKLKVVKLDRATLHQVGNSLFSGTEAGASGADVVQGSI